MKLGDSVDLIFNLLESVPAMGLTFNPVQIKGLREHLAKLRLKHPLEAERWDRIERLIDDMAAKHIDSL
jgi:hypothetical protein|tara:strand:- start:580 stop:786 length:207 start_codon:yes stop_codon:yes gene_type:complete